MTPKETLRPKARAGVGEKPLKVEDDMVRALTNLRPRGGHAGVHPLLPFKWQHRLPVVWPERKLIPFLERAWPDPGGSIFGPGEYLKVPCLHPEDPPRKDCERMVRLRCPIGQQGDRLWVSEFVRRAKNPDGFSFSYRADDAPVDKGLRRKLEINYDQPSFRAPNWAARIWLEITRVRLQRTTQMTGPEAVAEAVAPVESYRVRWDSLHGKSPGQQWEANPWMWVLELRRMAVA